MNVLSLFDGIETGRYCLEKAGIKVDKYYASEIDKYAMSIAMYNYPDIIQLGDGIINNEVVEISNGQRYKALGNGWTAEVIIYIFGYIKE